MVAIEATNVSKAFEKLPAVDDLSLSIFQGEIFGILGSNGAGKTTFVRMLATLMKPDSGSIQILGHDVAKHPEKVRHLIGLTGQYASVDQELTAYENLMLFGRLCGMTAKEAKTRTAELLAEFSLEGAARKPLKDFSGGMRRRLDLAVSLLSRPPLIFLDEPTTGLDPRTRGQMWETIRQLAAAGSTIVMTTQYLEEADQLADRIAILDHGKLVALGTPDQLKALGGSTLLELSLLNCRDLEEASKLVAAIFLEPATIVEEKCLITVPISTNQGVADLLEAFKSSGIELDEFAIKKPSLDDVFLKMTKEM